MRQKFNIFAANFFRSKEEIEVSRSIHDISKALGEIKASVHTLQALQVKERELLSTSDCAWIENYYDGNFRLVCGKEKVEIEEYEAKKSQFN